MQLKEIKNKYTTTNVRIGRPITECLSNELDSTIVYVSMSEKLDIQAFDIVVLTNEVNETEKWLVADYKEDYATFESPFLFNYTIQLMSLTKLLETIFLPDMTITNIGQNRSIYYYLNEASKYFKSDYGYSISLIDNALLSKTTNTVAYEYTFQEPTLREYIDTLLGQVGGICKLDLINIDTTPTFLIRFYDLNNNAGSMPTSYIKDIATVQDSDNYVSKIIHTTDDIISTGTITEYVQETTTDPVFTSENAQINFSHKVYDFAKLEALDVEFSVQQYIIRVIGNDDDEYPAYDGDDDSSIPDTKDVDISDLVVTTEEYSTLSYPKKSKYVIPTDDGDEYDSKYFYTLTSKKYITNTLTWDRDTNSITNIHNYKKFKDMWNNYDTNTSIENALRRSIWLWFKETYPNKGTNITDIGMVTAGQQPDDGPLVVSLSDSWYYKIWWVVKIKNYSYKTQLFSVEYKPYMSPKIEIADFSKRHLISSLDNETNTKTNILAQLDRSKEKLNKLAIPTKIMTAYRYASTINSALFNTYKVGQTWYDENNIKYVLTTLEKVVESYGVSFKGTLEPNYSNTIINTQLNREKRYFAYANTDTVTRKENIVKAYLLTLDNLADDPHLILASDYCNALFNYSNGTSNNYLIPVTAIANKDSIVYELQTMDNVAVAITKSQDSDAAIGGLPSRILSYVDDNGEFTSVNLKYGPLTKQRINEAKVAGKLPIEWACEIDVSECVETTTVDGVTTTESLVDNLFKHDLIHSGVEVSHTLNILKDNREKLNISTQLILKTQNNVPNSQAIIDFNMKNFYDYAKSHWVYAIMSITLYYSIRTINGTLEYTGTINSIEYGLFGYDFYALYLSLGGTQSKINVYIYADQDKTKELVTLKNYNGGLLNATIQDI